MSRGFTGRGFSALVLFCSILLIGLFIFFSSQSAGGLGFAAHLEDPPLHPDFSLDKEGFMKMVGDALGRLSSIPETDRKKIRRAIEQSPEGFLEDFGAMLKEDEQILFALVDKEHFLAADYVPPDLQSLGDYPDFILNRQDLSLRRRILPDLLEMVQAAAGDGILLDISSSYRSYAYQEGLFQRHVDQLGLAEAERVSARAGSSQHQLGTTVDFGSVSLDFALHPAGMWLAREAWRFGFSLSYPQGYEEITGYSYEPWHFRYLGASALRLQRLFFSDIQQYMLMFYDSIFEEAMGKIRPI